MQHIPNKTRADTVTGHLGMYKASCGERQCTSDIEMSLQAIKSNLLSKFPIPFQNAAQYFKTCHVVNTVNS